MPNVLLTFEDLHAGDVVHGQYAANGVTISSANAHKPAMVFDTDNPTGRDHDLATKNLGNVLIISEDGDSSDPDDNADGGTFVFKFDDPSEVVNFRALDVEEGGTVRLYDDAGKLIKTVDIPCTNNNDQVTVDLNAEGVARMEIELCGSGAIDNIRYVTPEPDNELDGVVEGSAGADVIDAGYDGDPDGDRIDANDEILSGAGPNDDIVDAFGGNDKISSGEGDDEVFAGSGDDIVDGGAGDDIIYGDSNYDGPGAGVSGRESLKWSEAPGFGNNADASGFTQNTGSVDVTFSILRETGRAETGYETDTQFVDGIDTGSDSANSQSSLYSVTKGEDNDADYKLEFSEAVENVQFRVNDIDGDGLVRIKAFDEDGDPIEVVLEAGDRVRLKDTDGVPGNDTGDARGGYGSDDDARFSMLVTIPGPVSRIVIQHDQNDDDNSGINITDVYFDAPEIVDDREDGNDTLLGGEGDDTIYGEGGDDMLNGQAGDDFLSGGAGDDEIIGGRGNDTIEGGDGDDVIRGNQGEDVIDGGAGDDTIRAGGGDDTVVGGLGDDTISGGAGDDTINAGDGDDKVSGGSGDDTVSGGIGDDTIITSGGNDTVIGGSGDDVIVTSGPSPLPDLGYPGLVPSDPNPNDDIDFVDGGDGDDIIRTGDDADTIFGGAGDDRIDGGFDADTIDGGDGDDRIVGGEGSDIINAGAGDDLVYAGIDPDLGLPDDLDITDEDTGGLSPDLVTNNGQDVVSGGDGNDTIYGADDDDVLSGDAGDDFIDGGIDDDVIDGGTGNDTLIGGQGADIISGGDDRDTIIVDNAEDGIGDIIDGGTGSTAPGDADDFDVLDLTGSGPLRIVGQTTDADGNSTSGTVEFLDGVGGNVIGSLQFSEIEQIVPCFTPGTSIATPRGEVLVEDLMVGDKVITRDNGIQEIRWIGAKRMDGHEFQNNPHLQPVRIQQGSLGNGLPERDMMVSPNHRMLVNNDRVALYFEENEVLVSAKHLVNPSEGIQTIASMGTTYIHFMFDNHQVVLSNGAWTESFQPGDYSLKAIGNAQRNEIFELFPELQGEAGREAYASARLTLKKHEAKLLFK